MEEAVDVECKLINKKMKNKKLLKTIFSATFFAVLTFLIFIPFINANTDDVSGYCGNMMSGLYGGYGSSYMIISWIIFILVIVLIISAIYWFIK
jgi:hypothetical protein